MNTPTLVPGDLLTVKAIMAILECSKSAAYAVMRELGSDLPHVGLRCSRADLEAWRQSNRIARCDSASQDPAAAPAPAPRRRRSRRGRAAGTRPACSPTVVAHGLTGPQLTAITGTGRKRS